MKTSNNKVILRGRLGKNPKVTPFGTNRYVANISIVTTESYKKDGEYATENQWLNLAFWVDQASFAELNLKKGMLVHLEGKLTHRSYTDKNNVIGNVSEVVVRTAYQVKNSKMKELKNHKNYALLGLFFITYINKVLSYRNNKTMFNLFSTSLSSIACKLPPAPFHYLTTWRYVISTTTPLKSF